MLERSSGESLDDGDAGGRCFLYWERYVLPSCIIIQGLHLDRRRGFNVPLGVVLLGAWWTHGGGFCNVKSVLLRLGPGSATMARGEPPFIVVGALQRVCIRWGRSVGL